MDIQFATAGCHSDGLVLQHTAEATHCVTFEVGEIYHQVIVLQMRADDVILNVFCVCDRQVDAPFLIHDVHRSNVVEATLGNCPAMSRCRAAVAAVGRIALHDVGSQLLHQILDELRA